VANNDLPQAGAELVLQGISEFLTNIAAATSGLTKLGTGLVELAGLSTRSSSTFDASTNRITEATQRIISSGTGLVDKYGNDLKTIGAAADTLATEIEADAERIVQANSKIVSLPNRDARGRFSGGEPQQATVINPQTSQAEEAHLELLVALEKELAAGRLAEGQAAAQEALNVARTTQALQQETAATDVLITRAKEVALGLTNVVKAQTDLDAVTRRVSIQTEAEQIANLTSKAQEGAAQLEKLAQAQRDLDTAAQKASAEREATQVNELATRASAASKQLELLAQAERDLQAASIRQSAIQEADAVAQLTARAEQLHPQLNQASGGSLNFVRAITALVSANNLLNVGALNTIFNIGTMAASFDRGGRAGLALGATIGVVLAGIGSLIGAYQNIISAGQAVIGTVVNITKALIDQGVAAADTAIKSAAGYQQSLAFFEALTGAPIGDLERLNDKITAVAETTIFGMPKAAEAVNELGRAGQSTFDIIDRGALDATIALTTAANGEVNLADAAKSLTGVVGSYTSVINGALTPTVSFGRAADVITASAQLSRLSFNDMLVAWRQAGPVAASTKISVEDLGAVLAILSNAGESASIAGTSFKQVILDLEKPSQNAAKELDHFKVSLFDGEHNLRPFRDLVIDMNRAFGEDALATGKVTEEEQKHALAVIFGSRAALAANIITNQGVQAFDAMKASMQGVTAVDMANILLLPLNARMEILQNSVQALAINMAGPLVSAFSEVVNKGLEFVRAIPIDAVRLLGQAIVAIATNEGFGVLQDKLAEIASPQSFQFFVSLLNFARNVRAAIMDEIIPAIIAAVDKIVSFEQAQHTVSELAGNFDKLSSAVRVIGSVIAGAINAAADFIIKIQTDKDIADEFKNVLKGLADVLIGSVAVGFVAVVVPMFIVLDILRQIGSAIDPVIFKWLGLNDAFLNSAAALDLTGITKSTDAFIGSLDTAASSASDDLNSIVDNYATVADGVVTANDVINESNVGIVDVINQVQDAVTQSLDETTKSYGDSASNVLDIADAEAQGLVDNVNSEIKAQAEGWDDITNVTGQGVENTADAMTGLDAPMEAVGNAPSSVAPSWASGWTAVANAAGDAINWIIDRVNDLLQAISSLGGEIAEKLGIAGNALVKLSPVGYFAVAHAVVETFKGIGDAAGKAHSAIDALGTINVPQVTRDTESLSGRLRTILDAIGASADKAREHINNINKPDHTEPGDYPVKPGGGGGGKGGKGAGRGAGAGPEDAYNKALDQAAEFADDLARTIQTAGLDAIQKLEDIARKAADSAATATREYYEKASQIKDKAKEQISEIDTNTDISRRDRARKEDLQKVLDNRARIRQFEREDRDNALSDERAAQDRKDKQVQDILDRQFALSQQNAATRRSREREDEDTAFKRKLDDEEKRQQKLEELRNKPGVRQTADDIRKIQSQGGFSKAISTDEVEKARLARQRATEDLVTARSRGRQDEDTRYEREQQQAAIDYKQGEDDKALALQQSRTTYDRARRRTDTIDDVNFAAQQKQEQQKLEDQIEDEGIKRRKDKIAKDRADSLAVAKREYDEKQQAIKDKAAEDAHTVLAGLDKTLEAAQNKIADKVPDIIKAGGDAMQPIMDEIVGNLTEQMGIVQSSAEQARDALGLAVGTREAVSVSGLVIDSMSDAIVTYTDGMTTLAQAAQTAAEAITNAVNSVPGATPTAPTKSPPNLNSIPSTNPSDHYVPPTGVGGGIGGGPPQLTSSQVVAPSASSVTVQNNTTYQVNASYADTQSPASIGLDLSALSAITQR
jgi:TP901 family phage tail tape measure protein